MQFNDLFEKLKAAGLFTWTEVIAFCDAYFVKSKSSAAIANICKPAVERWGKRYSLALDALYESKKLFEQIKTAGDEVALANAEQSMNECKQEKDSLELFKKDLGSFVRLYEFMSQIVDYEDKDLERLSLYARTLAPMLREVAFDEDDIDLDNVELSHYRLSKIKQQNLQLNEKEPVYIQGSSGVGTGKAKSPKEELLSDIITSLNELFVTDGLTEDDMVNYAHTIRDKVKENQVVMQQLANNSPDQAMLGEFSKAVDDAVMDSSQAHQNQMMQLLSDPKKSAAFAQLIFKMMQGGLGRKLAPRLWLIVPQ